jgi:hypothetical protein
MGGAAVAAKSNDHATGEAVRAPQEPSALQVGLRRAWRCADGSACRAVSHPAPLTESTLCPRVQAAAEAALADGLTRVALSYFNDLGSVLMDSGRYGTVSS